MQDGFNDKDIESALHLLNHPGDSDDPETQSWLEAEGHRNLLEELRRYREAGMRERGEIEFDEEGQWSLLVGRMASRKRKVHIYRRMAKLAAAVAVLVSVILFSFYRQKDKLPVDSGGVLVQEVEMTDAVKLITGNGKEYLLASNVSGNDTLSKSGIVIDSVGGLKYMKILQNESRPEEFHTIQVPRGGEYILILDDGTRVWVNSESELRYPVAFRGSERKVYLKGEAYFEVKRNEEHPFVVVASRMDIRVLGTEFNVQSYREEEENVTLVKGCVTVKTGGVAPEEVVLNPGENASLRGEQLHVEAVDVLKYTSWKEGFFYYNNVRLEEILDELGRWFDFTVFYRNPEVKDFRFKFWANRKDTVEQVIERLNGTGKLKIEVSGKTVTVFL